MTCAGRVCAGAAGAAIGLAAAAWLVVASTSAHAQALDADELAPALAEPAPPATRAPEPIRIYFSMWTTHLREPVPTLRNNWVIGMSGRGFFGATFLNSFGRRAFTGGLQRTLISTPPHTMTVSLGYRLGFVTGYDGRFMRLARSTPVLPLVQPFMTIDIGHVGLEASYSFVVVSTAVSYRF